MQTVDLLELNKTLRILAYGKPGSGKTTFLGSACDDDRTWPVLHVDVSGNPESLVKRPSTSKDAKMPTVLRLQKLSELNAIYDFFATGQPSNHVLCTKLGIKPSFKTLVFDGITAIQRKSFALVLAQENLKPGDIPAKAEWPVYRSVLSQMLNIATAFFQELRGIHVLVSCLEHTDMRTEPTSGRQYEYAEPGLQGQAVTELPGEALCVMRFATKHSLAPEIGKRLTAKYTVAQLNETRYVYAKDQHHFQTISVGEANYIADPTVSILLDQLGG